MLGNDCFRSCFVSTLQNKVFNLLHNVTSLRVSRAVATSQRKQPAVYLTD